LIIALENKCCCGYLLSRITGAGLLLLRLLYLLMWMTAIEKYLPLWMIDVESTYCCGLLQMRIPAVVDYFG
jgi:hypothetical protein